MHDNITYQSLNGADSGNAEPVGQLSIRATTHRKPRLCLHFGRWSRAWVRAAMGCGRANLEEQPPFPTGHSLLFAVRTLCRAVWRADFGFHVAAHGRIPSYCGGWIKATKTHAESLKGRSTERPALRKLQATQHAGIRCWADEGPTGEGDAISRCQTPPKSAFFSSSRHRPSCLLVPLSGDLSKGLAALCRI